MIETIVCPTCGGSGFVAEDFQPGATAFLKCPDCRQPTLEVLGRMVEAFQGVDSEIELITWDRDKFHNIQGDWHYVTDEELIPFMLAAWLAEHREDEDI
jgi:uncharacterized protein YbaR (Trm112 family)